MKSWCGSGKDGTTEVGFAAVRVRISLLKFCRADVPFVFTASSIAAQAALSVCDRRRGVSKYVIADTTGESVTIVICLNSVFLGQSYASTFSGSVRYPELESILIGLPNVASET